MKTCTLASHHTLGELIALKNKSSDDGQKLRLRAIIGIKKGNTQKHVSEELSVSEKTLKMD